MTKMPFVMNWLSSERAPAALGIAFGVWFMLLIYLISSGSWLRVAIAVPIGAAIIVLARTASRAGQGSR